MIIPKHIQITILVGCLTSTQRIITAQHDHLGHKDQQEPRFTDLHIQHMRNLIHLVQQLGINLDLLLAPHSRLDPLLPDPTSPTNLSMSRDPLSLIIIGQSLTRWTFTPGITLSRTR